MFGRRAKNEERGEEDVEVDIDLEGDLSAVENAVEDYLQSPDAARHKDLLAALEELDEQIAQGDAYMATLRFPFVGAPSSVIGATNSSSPGEEVPSSAFQAQVALVKAAKNAVTRLTPEILSDLRAAYEAVEAWRA
jgi:cell division septum initiation protein DivIVA